MQCADRQIHLLMEKEEEIKEKIKSFWPGAVVGGKLDRKRLGEYVLETPSQLRKLENILYPKLAESQKRFLQYHQRIGTAVVVLDVPLLLEVGLDTYCHRVILVEASLFIRKWRILRRSGMSLKKIEKFESHQYSEAVRRKGADFIIRTGRGQRSSLEKIKEVLSLLSQEPPPVWKGKWPNTLKREPYGKRNCP